MDLPDLLFVLIGLVMVGAALVVAAMNRHRDHPLRDRFAEEFDRVEYERARRRDREL